VDTFDKELMRGIYGEENKIARFICRQKWAQKISAWKELTILVLAFVTKFIVMLCLVVLALGLAPFLSLLVSLLRLVQRDYGDAGGDVANRRKLNAALDMFYALALLHSLFVIYWVRLRVLLNRAVWEVAAVTSEQCGGEEWSSTLVNMYRLETSRKFSKDGELPGNWNFITYGVQLLQSASAAGGDYDHGWGARMLDKLISGKDKSVRKKLLSSRLSILNLMDMIIGRCLVGEAPAGDMENRERAATIIAHLASHLHLTSFPGILQCICSLLESTSSCVPESHARPSGNPRVACPSVGLAAKKITTTLTKWMKWVYFNPITNPGGLQSCLLLQELRKYSKPKNRSPYKSRGAKELVSQGLLILERLTQDQRNCTEISKDQGLLSKITSPLTRSSVDHGDLLTRLSADNTTTVEMLSRSLTVLSRVLTSPGDDTARLRQKLATNTQAVSNLLGILEGDSGGAQKLHGQALEILTELALDGSLEEVDFHKLLKALLLRIFLEEEASSNVTEQWTNNNATSQVEIEHEQAGTETAATRLRGNAGEALARLLPVHAARGILSKQEATSLLNKVNRNLFAHLSSLQFPRCHLSC
jgi:hypothetical protein